MLIHKQADTKMPQLVRERKSVENHGDILWQSILDAEKEELQGSKEVDLLKIDTEILCGTYEDSDESFDLEFEEMMQSKSRSNLL